MSELDKVNRDDRQTTEVEADARSQHRPAGAARPPRLALALALLALLGVVAGLFVGYRYWHGMKSSLQQLDSSLAEANREQVVLREQLAQASRAIQAQQQKFAEQEGRLREQRLQWQQERQALQQQKEQLDHSLMQMQQRLGGEVDQWQVAEAEYLMRLAEHRLSLMADPQTALVALRAADARLRELADPKWNSTRDVLARQIAALEAVPPVDRSDLYARLTALTERVEQLPLQQEGVALVRQHAVQETPEEPGSSNVFELERIWQDLWQGFKSMMVIRHHDQPISAMLPPEQRYFLLQNLRLKLEGAKAALMGRNSTLYRETLQSTRNWLERYFAQQSPEVADFQRQLQDLAQTQIAPELPDISAALHTLQAHRKASKRGASE